MDIKEIFEGSNLPPQKPRQLDEVIVDWVKHSKGILNIAEHLEPNFKTTEHNKKILRLLLMYFVGTDAFVSELETLSGTPGDLNKGIMLIGGVGTGKSLIFKIFNEYTKNVIGTNSFIPHTAIDIIDTVNVSGVGYLELFNHNMVDRIARPIRCYIDDIGSKNETVKHFGTDLSVIEQLLSIRYNIFERYGTLTHVSTNKFPSEMKDLYDIRIIDRMKTMFNIIELGGESFRK